MKYVILLIMFFSFNLVASNNDEQSSEQTKTIVSSTLSDWLLAINPKGDFRFRYQNDHPVGYGNNRDRARIRLRGGIEPRISQDLRVGIGLATGFNNNNLDNLTDKDMARSTNQTLGDGFSKKSISLELGFAEYSPFSWLTLIVGKFKNPIWEPTDLIWDKDINPEGVSVKFDNKINKEINIFSTVGTFMLDEQANSSDPLMYILQAGIKHHLVENLSYKFALSYYGFSALVGKRLDGSVLTNSIDPINKTLIYNYRNLVGSLSVDIKKAFKDNLPYLSFFIEYVSNCNSKVRAKDRNGYSVGTVLGHEKLRQLSDWQFKYNYGKLGKDSIIDILPDSDRYGGQTAMWSHEITISYALSSSHWLGLDFYYGEKTEGSKKPATVLQLDWNIKF